MPPWQSFNQPFILIYSTHRYSFLFYNYKLHIHITSLFQKPLPFLCLKSFLDWVLNRSVEPSIYLSIYISIFLSIYLSISIKDIKNDQQEYICPRVLLYRATSQCCRSYSCQPSILSAIHPSFHLSINQSIYPYIHLSISPSIHIHPLICLSIRVSMY